DGLASALTPLTPSGEPPPVDEPPVDEPPVVPPEHWLVPSSAAAPCTHGLSAALTPLTLTSEPPPVDEPPVVEPPVVPPPEHWLTLRGQPVDRNSGSDLLRE